LIHVVKNPSKKQKLVASTPVTLFERPTRNPVPQQIIALQQFQQHPGPKGVCLEVLSSAWRVIEEVTFVTRNFANARAFMIGHAGANGKWGYFT
jgi:hypothetical protein